MGGVSLRRSAMSGHSCSSAPQSGMRSAPASIGGDMFGGEPGSRKSTTPWPALKPSTALGGISLLTWPGSLSRCTWMPYFSANATSLARITSGVSWYRGARIVVFVAALAFASKASNLDLAAAGAACWVGACLAAWAGACVAGAATTWAATGWLVGCAALLVAGGLAGAHAARLNTNRIDPEIQRDGDTDTRQLSPRTC